eukprot:COSAG01_NODE_12281_length_1766_cov_10.127175_1_plen_260_part_00
MCGWLSFSAAAVPGGPVPLRLYSLNPPERKCSLSLGERREEERERRERKNRLGDLTDCFRLLADCCLTAAGCCVPACLRLRWPPAAAYCRTAYCWLLLRRWWRPATAVACCSAHGPETAVAGRADRRRPQCEAPEDRPARPPNNNNNNNNNNNRCDDRLHPYPLNVGSRSPCTLPGGAPSPDAGVLAKLGALEAQMTTLMKTIAAQQIILNTHNLTMKNHAARIQYLEDGPPHGRDVPKTNGRRGMLSCCGTVRTHLCG